MKWSCDSEHTPTLIGESIYCRKCGAFIGNATNKDVVRISREEPAFVLIRRAFFQKNLKS